MPKNSIKSVLKNADIQKVFELFEKEIGNDKTLKIQQNIIDRIKEQSA